MGCLCGQREEVPGGRGREEGRRKGEEGEQKCFQEAVLRSCDRNRYGLKDENTSVCHETVACLFASMHMARLLRPFLPHQDPGRLWPALAEAALIGPGHHQSQPRIHWLRNEDSEASHKEGYF